MKISFIVTLIALLNIQFTASMTQHNLEVPEITIDDYSTLYYSLQTSVPNDPTFPITELLNTEFKTVKLHLNQTLTSATPGSYYNTYVEPLSGIKIGNFEEMHVKPHHGESSADIIITFRYEDVIIGNALRLNCKIGIPLTLTVTKQQQGGVKDSQTIEWSKPLRTTSSMIGSDENDRVFEFDVTKMMETMLGTVELKFEFTSKSTNLDQVVCYEVASVGVEQIAISNNHIPSPNYYYFSKEIDWKVDDETYLSATIDSESDGDFISISTKQISLMSQGAYVLNVTKLISTSSMLDINNVGIAFYLDCNRETQNLAYSLIVEYEDRRYEYSSAVFFSIFNSQIKAAIWMSEFTELEEIINESDVLKVTLIFSGNTPSLVNISDMSLIYKDNLPLIYDDSHYNVGDLYLG